MNTFKASNISLKLMLKYLDIKGAKRIRTKGSHLIYSHQSLNRPIPVQSNQDPVPMFIAREIMKYFGDSPKDFWDLVGKTKNKVKEETESRLPRKGKNTKKKD